MRIITTLLALLTLSACDDGESSAGPDADPSVDMAQDAGSTDMDHPDSAPDNGFIDTGEGLIRAPATTRGPLAFARTDFTVESEGRTLPVTLWYPTETQPGAPMPIWDAFLTGDDAAAYQDLVENGRMHCATTQVETTVDAPIVRSELPLVLLSHCHICTRFNMLTIAGYLASHGFVVAAPAHVGNTLFDELRGEAAAVGGEFLLTRGADIEAVLDALLGEGLPAGAAAVAQRIDPARVGVMGHSFGAVTAGWILENDPRVQAGVAVAAPMENPLVPGVTLASITQPTLHVVAVEDNSITELGNTLIRNNFGAIATPTYKVEVADAGHWSFSDIAGITEAFAAGCGDGMRQTNREPFTYLQPNAAIPLLATYATAFLRAHLADDVDAMAVLTGVPIAPEVTVETRP